MCCMVDGEASNLVAQMRRGVLPFCVLAMLGDGERYGFELVRALASVDGLVTGEGLVETTWRESDAGPPRRYYRLAPSGRATLAEFTGSWRLFRDSVDGLLQVGGKGGST
jgi:PadR family transcriptional regulator PadR